MLGQPVAPIESQPPEPSILTSARNRSGDGFGTRAESPEQLPPSELVNTPTPSSDSWRTGISYEDLSCVVTGSWPQCPDNVATKHSPVQRNGPVSSSPFWVYVPLECDFRLDGDELDRQAEMVLDAKTPYAMARALWMGEGLPASTTQPTLRRNAVDVSPAGSTVDLDDAIAVLLARYELATGGAGGALLHVPSVMMTLALGGGNGGATLARLEGHLYRGPNGSIVSPGPGYPFGASAAGPNGYGPATSPTAYKGNHDDEVWVYVTGPLEYALGKPFIAGPTPVGADLRQNVSASLAERQAIFRYDPCAVFAARALAPLSIAVS